MTKNSVYQLSARQILLLAFASALIAVGATALIYNYGKLLLAKNGADLTLAEQAPPPGISDPSSVSDEQNNIEVYRSISPGVAFINTTTYQQDFWGDVSEGKGNGSGSVIDANGNILTNYHVIEGAQKVTVSFGGDKVYPAKVIGGDPDTDLAIIKIDPPAGMTVVPLGDSDKLTVGQKVLAIGNPFGLDRTLTTGVISGLQRPIRSRPMTGAPTGRPIDAAIQTDASINPGNSGGPLLDKFGKMIGINSQILSPAGGSVGVGFAIPVSTAKRVIPQLLQFGEVRRPKLGASLISAADVNRRGYRLPVEDGLVLQRVDPGTTASNAGLKGFTQSATGGVALGDIIISMDGELMKDLDDLYRFLDKKQIGETVQVELYRNGANVKLPVKLLGTTASRSVRRME
ncbi:MAG: trypsin-like peptidase domain-containing protein [Pyrinomonadaceae bacterium]|nr:trypsin-like peptidase domain-containing protein [Acidobacteriota bacterium]MBP7377067.1 trypsin-like peptidase domain-containing protein [Pyrinomonadaceae bacterium]